MHGITSSRFIAFRTAKKIEVEHTHDKSISVRMKWKKKRGKDGMVRATIRTNENTDVQCDERVNIIKYITAIGCT